MHYAECIPTVWLVLLVATAILLVLGSIKDDAAQRQNVKTWVFEHSMKISVILLVASIIGCVILAATDTSASYGLDILLLVAFVTGLVYIGGMGLGVVVILFWPSKMSDEEKQEKWEARVARREYIEQRKEMGRNLAEDYLEKRKTADEYLRELNVLVKEFGKNLCRFFDMSKGETIVKAIEELSAIDTPDVRRFLGTILTNEFLGTVLVKEWLNLDDPTMVNYNKAQQRIIETLVKSKDQESMQFLFDYITATYGSDGVFEFRNTITDSFYFAVKTVVKNPELNADLLDFLVQLAHSQDVKVTGFLEKILSEFWP